MPKVKVISEYEGIPSGFNFDAERAIIDGDEYYIGIWSSPGGSYEITVPIEYCTVITDDLVSPFYLARNKIREFL